MASSKKKYGEQNDFYRADFFNFFIIATAESRDPARAVNITLKLKGRV
jgi:hypothetical protein